MAEGSGLCVSLGLGFSGVELWKLRLGFGLVGFWESRGGFSVYQPPKP